MPFTNSRLHLRQGLPQTVLAYVAGLIEGDGTISAGQGKSGYHISVGVTNGNLRLLEWLQTTVGGYLLAKKSSGQLGTSPQYFWRLKQGEAIQLCSLLLPYLIGKRHQAELVIEAGHLREGWRPGMGRRPALVRRRLQEIADECSWWNRRGWRGEEPPCTENTTIPEQAKLELVS